MISVHYLVKKLDCSNLEINLNWISYYLQIYTDTIQRPSTLLTSYLTRQLCQQRMQRLIIYLAYDCPQKCGKSLRDMIAVELNYWFYNFFWWPNGTSQVCVTLGATASNCLFAVIKIYATAIPMVVLPHLAERLNPKPECPRFKSHPQFFGQ